MIEQGLADRKLRGNLTDLISRTYESGGTVTVGPDDTLMIAYNRMRSSDVSQLPVVKGGRIVGISMSTISHLHVEGHDEAAQHQGSRAHGDDGAHRQLQAGDKRMLALIFERNEVAIA